MLTILEAIKLSTEYLEKKNVESARTNAELLLAEVLKCKRLELYLAFDKPLSEDETSIYRDYIKKRGQRIPLQYIVGKVEFYGLELSVNRSVLIPRPETELLVEQIFNDYKSKSKVRILDIGSGSGNISIALAKNLNDSKLIGIDISEEAIIISRLNAETNSVQNNIDFLKLDIKSDDPGSLGKFDIIVSNPPYVSLEDYHQLEPELKDYEPKQALTDDADGISFYKRIIDHSRFLLNEKGRIYFEIGKGQHNMISELLSEAKFEGIKVIKDLSGIERIICGVMR